METIDETILQNRYFKKLKNLEIATNAATRIPSDEMTVYREKLKGEYKKRLNKIIHRNHSEKSQLKVVEFSTPGFKGEEQNHIFCFFAECLVIWGRIEPNIWGGIRPEMKNLFANFENDFKKEIM